MEKSVRYVMRGADGPKEPKEVDNGCGVFCRSCGRELEVDEVYGECEGRTLCQDCLDNEWTRLSVEEKYERLGYEVVRQVGRKKEW